ncbi:OB-fold-containig protein [Thermosynechococcus vestitus]|uniref:Tlr0354 protein n=1 Tax=Thermosynechococcus vestitus (strain NIES-2133 / IAM M-273 / BP-1) TaxID=197221 RepID=Q8DLX2_THEVB|nr:OB-fold-containig protein [Thermosynechococcus vestitus]BAC07906.1 tlr0354 [Thermosynechococcus vestitus BP-1]
MLFHLIHTPYWIVLGMGILLFLTVIFGEVGDDEVELEGDADPSEMAVDVEEGISFLAMLHWLGVGRAPLILLLALDFSLLGVLGWFLNVLFYTLSGTWPGVVWSGVIAIAALLLALTIGGLCSRPLGQIFAQFSEDTRRDRLLGCSGHVSSAHIPRSGTGIGQVSVLDANGNRLLVPAVLPPWATVTPQQGQEVLIIDRQGNEYIVVTKDSWDEAAWLRQHGHSQMPPIKEREDA